MDHSQDQRYDQDQRNDRDQRDEAVAEFEDPGEPFA